MGEPWIWGALMGDYHVRELESGKYLERFNGKGWTWQSSPVGAETFSASGGRAMVEQSPLPAFVSKVGDPEFLPLAEQHPLAGFDDRIQITIRCSRAEASALTAILAIAAGEWSADPSPTRHVLGKALREICEQLMRTPTDTSDIMQRMGADAPPLGDEGNE